MSNFYLCDSCAKTDTELTPEVECLDRGKLDRVVVVDNDERPLKEICPNYQERQVRLCQTCAKEVNGLPPAECAGLRSILGHAGEKTCPQWESKPYGSLANIMQSMFEYIVDTAWDQGKVVSESDREYAEWLVEALAAYDKVDPESWTWKQ